MNDKEIVERAKEAEKRTGFGELVHSPISKGVNSAYGIGFIEGMVEYRNSMQEEPVTLVWHEPSEIPEEKKWILLAHKEGWYHVGRLYEGQRRNLVISDGVSTFELNMFNKWVYVDDILKF